MAAKWMLNGRNPGSVPSLIPLIVEAKTKTARQPELTGPENKLRYLAGRTPRWSQNRADVGVKKAAQKAAGKLALLQLTSADLGRGKMKKLPAIDYTSHPAYSAQEVSGETVRAALEAFEPILFRKMGLLRESEDLFRSRVSSHRDSTVATFAREGAVAMSIPAKDLHTIRTAAAGFETELRERINGKRRIRLRFRETQLLVHSDSEVVSGFEGLHAALQKALKRSGTFEVAEAYFGGHKASLARTVYRINVEGQPFYNNLFSDPSIQLPQTTGFHIDANGRPAINGTLYLSDVSEGQGAFENITGSNHWAFELEDRAIRKTFDDRIIRAETERFLMSLPQWFRRRANFGHDLVEGSDEARQLLANRHSYTGEAGSLILFDPDAVHRGGDVRKGERIAIIFGLQMERRP